MAAQLKTIVQALRSKAAQELAGSGRYRRSGFIVAAIVCLSGIAAAVWLERGSAHGPAIDLLVRTAGRWTPKLIAAVIFAATYFAVALAGC